MRTATTSILTTFLIAFCTWSAFSSAVNSTLQQPKIKGRITYDKKTHRMTLSWPAFGTSGAYSIERGGSRLALEYKPLGTTAKLNFIDKAPNANKYENYYKVTRNGVTILMSLENQLFGDNVFFYDRKYENAETSRNEINSHFSVTGQGGPNGEWTTKRQAYYFKPNAKGQSYDPGGSGFGFIRPGQCDRARVLLPYRRPRKITG